MRISNIDRITPESVVLSIEIPSEIKSLFKYIAGQYISLELDIESKTIRRSYSICSAPKEELLQVGIKEVKNVSSLITINEADKLPDFFNFDLFMGSIKPSKSDSFITQYGLLKADSSSDGFLLNFLNLLNFSNNSDGVFIFFGM